MYNKKMIDVLAKLFGSKTRVKMLRLFLANKVSAFTLAEIVKRTKVAKEAVRKELALLAKVGLLSTEGKGKDKKWSADSKFAYLRQLENLVLESGESDSHFIADKLKKAGDIKMIVVAGAFVPDAPNGDVDILIVGNRLTQPKVDRVVAEIEANFGRELRFAMFTPEDFTYRMDIQDRLLRDVFDYPHEIIVDKLI